MERITFKINGEEFSVGSEVCSDTSLLQYLRDTLQMPGTKYMCREAGCGACIVAAATSPGGEILSVNSCIVPILSCQDWEITTIEKVGNRKDGYHPIQEEFVKQNASQCGYCTPGWVMNMYSLLKSNKELTMLEIEKSFGSNICRCTGYRAILDAIKSFATDSPVGNRIADIEDLKICGKTGETCSKTSCKDTDWCLISKDKDIVEINLKDDRKWFLVGYVFDIFQILIKEGNDSYMLIHGNTGKVPYPIAEYPRILINISKVEELQTYVVDQNLIVGAGVTITKLLEIFENVAKMDGFGYLEKLVEHLKLVAHIPVRNLGSMGGNLMIKHQHNEFQSDIFLLLETVGADLTLVSNGGRQVVTMGNFLRTDMKGKVILNAMLPPLSDEYRLKYFKIMQRAQNVVATVNAGFLYQTCSTDKVLQCRIVYGNLSPSFNRAMSTEQFLVGKNLFSNETLQSALQVLKKELIVIENPPEASAQFRKQLALNLFYKGLLYLCSESKIHPRLASGAVNIRATRPVSQARQVYDTDKALWPINQPLKKVEALIQSSGEAQYTDDIPKIAHEAYVSYVVTTVATGTIKHIDASLALNHPGVLGFFSAKDIPGLNSFLPTNVGPFSADEEVFCEGTVKYFNQPLGIIVAETQKCADEASELVKVIYTDVKPPVLDIKVASKDPDRVTPFDTKKASDKGDDIAKVIKHDNTIYGQYPLTMETIVCVVRPTDKSLEVYSTTQWVDAVQLMIYKALKIDSSKGTAEAVAMVELKMERIAYELSLDPLAVRLANLDSKYDELRTMLETIKGYSDYENRRKNVKAYNAGNRWKKRGLRITLLRWTPVQPGGVIEVLISIYHGDGTVAIVHGGVEMGQGINTKVVQMCAHLLDIPVEKIQIKPNNSISSPNGIVTGGSVTSQNVGYGVKKCCDVISKRLAPIKAQLDNPTWEEVVTKAYQSNVSLMAHGYFRAQDFESYVVYGVTVAEVEIDVLTGECEVLRVDLIEDVGQSLNPEIDIGQIEGAFIMGLGYWTCEKLVYNTRTGELLTDRTWNYHVPQALDIPQDFRIYLRKNSYNNESPFGSKSVGEPPLCMSHVIPLAIREAISSARLDAGIPTNQWFPIDGPYNLESIGMSTGTQLEHMLFF